MTSICPSLFRARNSGDNTANTIIGLLRVILNNKTYSSISANIETLFTVT
jgi:hypothetical protein